MSFVLHKGAMRQLLSTPYNGAGYAETAPPMPFRQMKSTIALSFVNYEHFEIKFQPRPIRRHNKTRIVERQKWLNQTHLFEILMTKKLSWYWDHPLSLCILLQLVLKEQDIQIFRARTWLSAFSRYTSTHDSDRWFSTGAQITDCCM